MLILKVFVIAWLNLSVFARQFCRIFLLPERNEHSRQLISICNHLMSKYFYIFGTGLDGSSYRIEPRRTPCCA